MRSHARRFVTDLRRVGGWVFTILITTLVVAILTTYTAVFSVAEGGTGTLSTTPPHEPLGFLRVIDASESIVRGFQSIEDAEKSVLDEPGLQVLLDGMVDDDRMFIALPISAFIQHFRAGNALNGIEAYAVMGTAPPFLDEAPRDGTVQLWGSLDASPEAAAWVSDRAIHGHPVRQMAEDRLTAEYVAGSGHRISTSDLPTVAFDVPTGRAPGVQAPPHVSEVVRGFSCYYDTSELVGLAEAMTEAEMQAGTGRVFYAVGYDGLIGPVERSRALSATLLTGHAFATLLSVWCLVLMVAQVV